MIQHRLLTASPQAIQGCSERTGRSSFILPTKPSTRGNPIKESEDRFISLGLAQSHDLAELSQANGGLVPMLRLGFTDQHPCWRLRQFQTFQTLQTFC